MHDDQIDDQRRIIQYGHGGKGRARSGDPESRYAHQAGENQQCQHLMGYILALDRCIDHQHQPRHEVGDQDHIEKGMKDRISLIQINYPVYKPVLYAFIENRIYTGRHRSCKNNHGYSQQHRLDPPAHPEPAQPDDQKKHKQRQETSPQIYDLVCEDRFLKIAGQVIQYITQITDINTQKYKRKIHVKPLTPSGGQDDGQYTGKYEKNQIISNIHSGLPELTTCSNSSSLLYS